MDRWVWKEGEVIQHSMITKSLTKRSEKWRKIILVLESDCLEYDDVDELHSVKFYKPTKKCHWKGERPWLEYSQNIIYDVIESLIDMAKSHGRCGKPSVNAFSTLGVVIQLMKTNLKSKD